MNKKYIPINEVKNSLDSISESFCLAKWLQTTTTLFNGMTHSCHHPGQHKIDFDSVQQNFKYLHNTPIKIEARRDMLKGVQTKECDYCWRIENLKDESIFSDRVNKSSESWAMPNFKQIIYSKLGENIDPTYLEVSFENTCNFACYYCLPEISSRILGEVEKFGPYQLTNGTHNDVEHLKQKGSYPIHRDEFNPYVEAFWKWWPELKNNLHTFRITGGEPLLSKHTWKIFEDLKNSPHQELTFAVNSNFGVPRNIIDNFISEIPKISESVKSFAIYTSAEAIGEQQEYSRFGMDWLAFVKNTEDVCEAISNIPNAKLVIMSTVNALSAATFNEFLDFVISLKSKFGNSLPDKIVVSINFLRHPAFGCITNISESLKNNCTKLWSKYLIKDSGLNALERSQLSRLIAFMHSSKPNITQIEDAKLFFSEYDKRRNIDFIKTFGNRNIYDF